MKTISINKAKAIEDLNILSGLLDKQEKHELEFIPWSDYSYKPGVSFSILYSESSILLKFFVKEKEIRAVENEINGRVWEDSCVEFFISLNNNENYYNFEFNCIGTSLVGYGPSKKERRLLPNHIVKKINTQSTIQHSDEEFNWHLTIQIPVSVFIYDQLVLNPGKECRVNFYKCGDLHKTPHFVTWNKIESQQPDFHLPDFFGKLCFQ